MKDDVKVSMVIIFIITILVLSIIPLTVQSVTFENQYGKLEVYPDTSRNIIRQKQFFNATSYLSSQELDIAFRFNESLTYGGVYNFNGSGYNKVDVEHIEYNDKHWYLLNDIYFEQYETKYGYWEYDIPINTSGKWDMFIKRSSDSLQYAIQNDLYVHLDPWWNSTYNYRKNYWINSSYIDNQLINFPIKVHLINSTEIALMDGGDSIRFVDTLNTSEYYYEIEKWSASDCIIWVNVSKVLSGSNTHFNMYFNNTLVSDGQNLPKTWDSGYVAVFHLDDIAGGTVYDSLSNHNSIAISNVVTDTTSMIGTGGTFSDGYINLTYTSDLGFDVGDDFTISAWFKSSDDSNNHRIFIVGDRGGSSYYGTVVRDAGVGDEDHYLIIVNSGGSAVGTYSAGDGTMIVDGNWHFITGVYKQADGLDMFSYLDDAIDVQYDGDQSGSMTGLNEAYIGSSLAKTSSHLLSGDLDEVRISEVARNTSWVKAEFHSGNQSTNFLIGSEIIEKPIDCECILTDEIPTNKTSDLEWTNLNLTVTINSTCVIDYVNISLNNGSFNYYKNYSAGGYSNSTFFYNDSFNLSSNQNVTWFVNTSCNGTQNNSFFWFITFGVSLDDVYNEIIYVKNKTIGVDDELNINIGLDGTILTLVLFCIFFIVGYIINKRSGGILMIFSGFTLIAFEFLASSVLNALLVIPLLSPIAILIIILGVRKWLYPVENEKTKSEGT